MAGVHGGAEAGAEASVALKPVLNPLSPNSYRPEAGVTVLGSTWACVGLLKQPAQEMWPNEQDGSRITFLRQLQRKRGPPSEMRGGRRF